MPLLTEQIGFLSLLCGGRGVVDRGLASDVLFSPGRGLDFHRGGAGEQNCCERCMLRRENGVTPTGWAGGYDQSFTASECNAIWVQPNVDGTNRCLYLRLHTEDTSPGNGGVYTTPDFFIPYMY